MNIFEQINEAMELTPIQKKTLRNLLKSWQNPVKKKRPRDPWDETHDRAIARIREDVENGVTNTGRLEFWVNQILNECGVNCLAPTFNERVKLRPEFAAAWLEYESAEKAKGKKNVNSYGFYLTHFKPKLKLVPRELPRVDISCLPSFPAPANLTEGDPVLAEVRAIYKGVTKRGHNAYLMLCELDDTFVSVTYSIEADGQFDDIYKFISSLFTDSVNKTDIENRLSETSSLEEYQDALVGEKVCLICGPRLGANHYMKCITQKAYEKLTSTEATG